MKKLIPYLALFGALALVWHATQLRLEVYGYSHEDITRALTFAFIWRAIPALFAAVALSTLYKRVTVLPRIAFFLILLAGAILISRYPSELTGAVVFYLTLKNRALFFRSTAQNSGPSA